MSSGSPNDEDEFKKEAMRASRKHVAQAYRLARRISNAVVKVLNKYDAAVVEIEGATEGYFEPLVGSIRVRVGGVKVSKDTQKNKYEFCSAYYEGLMRILIDHGSTTVGTRLKIYWDMKCEDEEETEEERREAIKEEIDEMRTILRYIVLVNIGHHWNIERLRNYLDGMAHAGYIPCYNLMINETRIWRHENDITIHLEAPCKELFEI